LVPPLDGTKAAGRTLSGRGLLLAASSTVGRRVVEVDERECLDGRSFVNIRSA
jgi:hypothetical protein